MASISLFASHRSGLACERGAGVYREHFDNPPSIRLRFHSDADGCPRRDGHIATGFQNRNMEKRIADASLQLNEAKLLV